MDNDASRRLFDSIDQFTRGMNDDGRPMPEPNLLVLGSTSGVPFLAVDAGKRKLRAFFTDNGVQLVCGKNWGLFQDPRAAGSIAMNLLHGGTPWNTNDAGGL